MEQPIRIIGICLIKNEDIYIERVLKNVIDFCDEIIVLDNMSTDGTYEKVERLAQEHSSIRLQKIEDYKTSHNTISPYAGTLTWLFRVDGDEIYDPAGLEKIRQNLKNNQYQDYWRIEGNSLNCTDIDLKNGVAKGYLSPPSKPAPMLYNFSMLQSWDDAHAERLHGNNIVFKAGFSKDLRLSLFKKYSWEDSPFRCLHICFINRSSLEKKKTARLNPNELSIAFSKPINFLRNLFSGKFSLESNYKLAKYRQGSLHEKSISKFFPEE